MAHHGGKTGFGDDLKYFTQNPYPIHILSLWNFKNLPDTAQGAVNRRDVCINKTVFSLKKHGTLLSLSILF